MRKNLCKISTHSESYEDTGVGSRFPWLLRRDQQKEWLGGVAPSESARRAPFVEHGSRTMNRKS